MKTIIKTYIEGLKQSGKSEHTIRSYVKDLTKLISYFNIETVEDVKALTLSDFQNFYSSTGLKQGSLNGLIRNLKAFFNWMINSDIIEDSKIFNVRFGGNSMVTVKRKVKMVLSDDEVMEMIKAADNIQTKFMIALMSFTAIRRGEAAQIKLTDISGCEIKIHGKGGKEDIVYMDEVLCNMFKMYCATRETDSPYLFYGTRGEKNAKDGQGITGEAINERIKKAGRLAGIDEKKLNELSAHRLRGSTATLIIKKYGIDAARLLLRHSSTSTTQLYNSNGNDFVKELAMNRRIN